MNSTRRDPNRAAAWALCSLALVPACKGGGAPSITDPGDQTAIVGQQLRIDILATDPDGDSLDFRFAAGGVPDLAQTATMSIAPDGRGVFTFTPLASQLGSHLFDFVVSDGDNDATVTININVIGAGGDGTLPVFRKPLGNGTVLDLEQADCVDFEIAVDDPDSSTVTLSQVPPTIQDSDLSADSSGLNGRWSWCPNREQLEAADRYDLTLSAQDIPANPATLKDYVVVLRRRSGSDCPGDAPVIMHTAQDMASILDLPVEARVTDDIGLKNAPILLYSYTDPGTPIDYSAMTVVDMRLMSGDMKDGTWRGHVPNPVVAEIGASADIWYAISASDNDDIDGDCDHLTDSPATGTHRATLTNDGSGVAGLCGHCSADAQCGGADLCVSQEGGAFCASACTGDAECDAEFVCSPTPVQSIDGASARQCIPASGTCLGAGAACTEDEFEDNDDLDQAGSFGAFALGVDHTASLCGDTNDWFQFDLGAGRATGYLSGPSSVDIDIVLTNAGGVLIAASTALQSDEEFTTPCLEAGTYFLRVFAPNSTVTGDYTFGVELGACNGSGGGEGDCCAANGTPGCEDDSVTACVCGIDDFCCDNAWDNTCVTVAESMCGLECGVPTNHDCCVTGGAGCDDAGVQACVCDSDPFCCEMEWDSVCVGLVGSQLCAPSCDPDDDDGPCCTANATPGCEVDTVETCVCAMDAACCSMAWDSFCVDEVDQYDCGTCP